MARAAVHCRAPMQSTEETGPRPSSDDGTRKSEWLRDCLPGLHAFVRLKFGPSLRAHEASIDIVQSVCAEVLAESDDREFERPEAFRAWLHKIAIHKIADRHRFWQAERRRTDREAGDLRSDSAEELLGVYASVCTPSRHASAREQIERVESAFAQLSERHRDVILEARILGRDRQEMADERGIDRVALRQLLARAMASLADSLIEDP